MKSFNFSKIKSLFKTKPGASRSLITFDPEADWKTVVHIFIGVLVLIIIANGYIFWGVYTSKAKQDGAVSTEPTSISVLNNNDLVKVVNAFADRKEAYQKLYDAPPVSIDPSR